MMKSEAISQIELILPAAVVEACYKLKRTAGSKFRALDKTAGTSSDIVLFKQPDESVCINISVTRICVDNTNSEDTAEIFNKFSANHIKCGNAARRGSRQGRGAFKNGCTRNGPAVLPVPPIPVEKGRTARRARGRWRGGQLRVRKSREEVTEETELSDRVEEIHAPEPDDHNQATSSAKQQDSDAHSKLTQSKNAHIDKESTESSKVGGNYEERKKGTKAKSVKNVRKAKGNILNSKKRLRASTLLKNAEKLDNNESQEATKPKKTVQKMPVLRKNLRNNTTLRNKVVNKPLKAVKRHLGNTKKEDGSAKEESGNELSSSESPKKAKKSSDKLANIWGNKRKRRINKKPKPSKEVESPEKTIETVESETAGEDKSLDNVNAKTDVVNSSFQNGMHSEEMISDSHVKHTSENVETPISVNKSITETVTHSETVFNHQSEMTQGDYMQPQCNFQPDHFTGTDMYHMPTHQSILETLHPPNHIDKQDFMRNHSHYPEINECFPPAQQPGFIKNTYEQMSLETNFESNIQAGYGLSGSGEEVQHITLTNVSDNLADESRLNHMADDHLKLPQKKRPMARQMIDPDVPVTEWDTDHRMMHSNMLDRHGHDPAAQAELEMSVHTLQTVMASEEEGVASMEYSLDEAKIADENESEDVDMKSNAGAQKKTYKREYRIQCRICHVKVKDYAYLFRHIGKIHQNMPDHREYMEEIRPLMRTPCPICGITVSSISNLASHMRQKHSDSTDMVTCPTCHKVYKTANSLKQHMRICHSEDEKRHVCDICQAKFAERRGLEEHMNCSHVTTKVFNCEVCGKTFLTKGRLRRHILIHGEFRYKCHYCNKGFHLKDNMNKHVEIVHEKNLGKRFECQYCSKKFSVKGNMMQHVMGVHLKKYQYSCSLCNTGFRRKGDLMKHVEQKHPESVPESIMDLSGSDSQGGAFDVPMTEELPDPSSPIMISPNPPPDEIIHTQVLTPAML